MKSSIIMKIFHPTADLYRPVDDDIWWQRLFCKNAVQWTSPGIFHHETKVRRLKADSLQLNNVAMTQQPEQLGLFSDTVHVCSSIVDGICSHQLHSHILSSPDAVMNITVSTVANHVSERRQFFEVNFHGNQLGDALARKYSHLIVDLPGPPTFIARDSRIFRQNVNPGASPQRQFVLTRRLVVWYRDQCVFALVLEGLPSHDAAARGKRRPAGVWHRRRIGLKKVLGTILQRLQVTPQ